MSTQLVFFELEWAAVDDAAADEHLADPRLDFARHHLRSVRRYRPHLLTEPEEVVLTEKNMTGASAWVRLFDELESAITLELDGETMSLEGGSVEARVTRPPSAPDGGRGRHRGSRARAAHARVRVQHVARRQERRRPPAQVPELDREPQPLQRGERRVGRGAGRRGRRVATRSPQRWYRLKAQLLGVDRIARLRPHVVDRVVGGRVRIRPRRASSCSTRTRRSRPISPSIAQKFFDEQWIDAPGPSGQATGRVLRVHRADAPPVRVAQLDVASPRRADARARARSRDPRVPRARRRACSTRERRSRWPRPRRCSARRSRSAGCCRRRRIRTNGSRCSRRTSRARSRRCSARSR